MKTRLKKFLNKHKNRIFSFIAVIACIPLLNFNAFASTVVLDFTEAYEFNHNRWFALYSGNYFDLNTGIPTGQGAGLLGKKLTTTAGVPYSVSNVSSYSNCTFINFMCSSDTYPILTDVYDYYLYGSLISDRTFSFRPNNLLVTYFDGSTKLYDYDDFTVSSFSIDDVDGFQFYCKLDMSSQNGINAIILNDSDAGVVGTNLSVWYYLIPILKDSSGEQVQSIISAINNQTDTLGNYIDKGNGSTGGIVSDNNSAIDNLDDVVSEYRATEETFFNDFNTNQQAITSDIVGWSWGGLVNCANWVGDTLTSYYNNMGDFRQYIIYPLMLGIALFFLGRGGSIIGHLFRKPTETIVNTKSVFRREGNTRYTTTTTSRQGGVWRK